MSENKQYAGFLVRLVAYFIDGLIVSFLSGIIVVFFAIIGLPFGEESPIMAILVLLAYLISIIGIICYYAYFESSDKQATPGKMAMGLKVIGKEGGKISFANAIGRYFAKILSAAILYIGFIMIAFDEKKQGLHDKLASTYVVKK